MNEREMRLVRAFGPDVHGIKERAAILEDEAGRDPQTALRAAVIHALVGWIPARPEPVDISADAFVVLQEFVFGGSEGHSRARGDVLPVREGKVRPGRRRGVNGPEWSVELWTF